MTRLKIKISKYFMTLFFSVFIMMILINFLFELFKLDFTMKDVGVEYLLFYSMKLSAELLVFILGFLVLIIGSLKSKESIYISALYLWVISGAALFIKDENFTNNPVSMIAFLLWLPFVFIILILSKKYIKILNTRGENMP